MYPLKFKPKYIEKIWGGSKLKAFKCEGSHEEQIGESWEIVDREDYSSVIANGYYKGKTLKDLKRLKGEALLGPHSDRLPILIKFIDAKEKLSIQVHPSNDYASIVEQDAGKTEAWYVIDAAEGAEIIAGIKPLGEQSLKEVIDSDDFEEKLRRIEVKPGDCIFIESGLIHGICGDILLAEVQQNSDVTYRVFDYNRGRELHIDKSLDVIQTELQAQIVKGQSRIRYGYKKTHLIACDEFEIVKLDIARKYHVSEESAFKILTCIQGSGEICCDEMCESIEQGETILIPAELKAYDIKGHLVCLATTMPDREDLC